MYVEEYDEQETCPYSVTRDRHAKIRSGFLMPRWAARLNRKCVPPHAVAWGSNPNCLGNPSQNQKETSVDNT